MDRIWTSELVEQRLVEAMRGLQGAGLYSPTKNVFRILEERRRLTGLELLQVTSEVLGRDSFERKALLTWARAQTGIGDRVSAVCREMGWQRRSFDDARKRAARRVARWIALAARLDDAA